MKRAPGEVEFNIVGPPDAVAQIINTLSAALTTEHLKKCEELTRRAEEAAEKAHTNAEAIRYRR